MDLKIVAWLYDDETSNAKVILGAWTQAGHYAEALIKMSDSSNAIFEAVAAERERCAALCEAHAGMRGTGAWTVLTAAADRIRDPERAKRDAALIREA